MSWVDNVVRAFRYECCNGHTIVKNMKSSEGRGHPPPQCPECKERTVYVGFHNVAASKGGLPNKPPPPITFEQNGRKAVKMGNTYLSKTKLDYMETGKVENQYTAAYQEKINQDAANAAVREAAAVARRL